MSFHNETHVKKTRRASRCDWCGEPINQGNPSFVHAGIHEGDFYCGRYHPECRDAIQRWWVKYGRKGDEWPDFLMNRGGIEDKGEPEE